MPDKKAEPYMTEKPQQRFVYRHVQFNHAITSPGQLLDEHDSRWELIRIVPYDAHESILVLRSAE